MTNDLEMRMRLVAFLVGPFAMAALVIAFGWPVLVACFALAWGTFLFSTGASEAEGWSTTLGAEGGQPGRRGHATAFAGSEHAVLRGVGSVDTMHAEL
jgi:hypothetical protein